MTTRVYKLTTQQNTTHNDTPWGTNVSHKTDGEGDLCGPGWLHAYTDPLLAVLLNPQHANIINPKLWLAYGSGQHKNDNGLKVGFTKLTTKQELPLPVITATQKIAFGILCALEVYKAPTFVSWALKWLSGEDRSIEVAYAAGAAYDAYAAYAASAADAAGAAGKPLNLKALAKKAMKVKP